MILDFSDPGSFEDVVNLLVPELQRRGLMWQDYLVPGGTCRENLQGTPGNPYLADHHPYKIFFWKWGTSKKIETAQEVGAAEKPEAAS